MKKIYNYTFRAVCIYVVIFFTFVYVTTGFQVQNVNKNVLDANITKELNSIFISSKKKQYEYPAKDKSSEIVLEADKEKEEEEGLNNTDEIELVVTPEVTKEPVIEVIPESEPTTEPKVEEPQYTYTQTLDTTNSPVIATVSGNVSHYGHDCHGCTSGKTATGYDISDGRIYYPDSTYGDVRIVAAGGEYPFGTILRLSNSSTSPIVAIVLDRGGAIGNGKKYVLDLLAESEAAAYQAGVKYNMTIEVLRMGY